MSLPIRVEAVDYHLTDLYFQGELIAFACPACGDVWETANRETQRIDSRDVSYARDNGSDLAVCGACGAELEIG